MSAPVAPGPGVQSLADPAGVDEMHAAAARIESLLESSAAGGPAARARSEDLVACVSGLYGAGLERILQIIASSAGPDAAVLDALATDPLVSGLLLVHDLHPYDVGTRVSRALDGVRPYLGSHGGDVELVGIDEDGVLSLRLLGSCDGCPSSSVTLELAVEDAVQAAAPELTRIDVLAASAGAPAGNVISVESLRSHIDRPEQSSGGTWVPLPELDELASGEVGGFDADGLAVCACRIGSDLFCFHDVCGRCGGSLAGSIVERRLGDPVGSGVLRCARCRAHFDVRRAGAGVDDDSERLAPLPLLIRAGTLSVAVPVPVP